MSAMADRIGRKAETKWDSICQWARLEGVDPKFNSLAEASEGLLSVLEICNKNILPLPNAMVRLADLLIILQGKLVIMGEQPSWNGARRLCGPGHAHPCAKKRGAIFRPKSEIRESESADERPAVGFDVLRTFQRILGRASVLRELFTSVDQPPPGSH
jgi:hypothetical protein